STRTRGRRIGSGRACAPSSEPRATFTDLAEGLGLATLERGTNGPRAIRVDRTLTESIASEPLPTRHTRRSRQRDAGGVDAERARPRADQRAHARAPAPDRG